MSKYADHEVSAFLLNSGYSLKQIIRVAKELREGQKADQDERDADFEMGHCAMPSGYMKRRKSHDC